MNLGRVIARSTIGGVFVGHGAQKLFGWWNGPGLEGTTQMMEKLEMRPARRHALASALAETVGGGMLVAGALTPLAGALLNGVMFTAIRKVHLDKGFWNTGGGYEYNLVLIGAITALVDSGPGAPSVDSSLGNRGSGSGWALAALAAGAAGSAAAIEVGRRAAQPDEDEVVPTGRFAREQERAAETAVATA
jgi:putative oxidoreductase